MATENLQRVKRLSAVGALASLLLLVSSIPVLAGKRIALVIGNSAYRNIATLANPRRDAELMASVLRQDGFALIGDRAQLDLDKAGLEALVQKFGSALVGAEVGLFYYAGHGVQIRGNNYLVPVSANPAREADVDFQMLDVNVVLRQMEAAGTRLNLVVLDACRNNPFGGQGLRAANGGLAQMRAPEGTLISFSTQPGNVALDGDSNSPFTKALGTSLRKPGLDVFQTFNDVGLAVKRETGGSQQPWVSSSPIDGQFYFVAPPAGNPAPDPAAQAWAAVRDTTSIAVLDTYIRQFGNSIYAPFAKARRDELTKVAAAAPNVPASPTQNKIAVVTPSPSPDPATARKLSRQDAEKLFSPLDEAVKDVQANYVEQRDEQDLYGAATTAIRRAFPLPQQVAGQPNGTSSRTDRNQFYATALEVLNARATAVEDEKITDVAIRGLMASLDAHSSFIDANAYRVTQGQMSGSFGGIGVQITVKDGLVKVITANDGAPAARAGIAANDVIAAIDSLPVQAGSTADVAAKLRGAPGSKVHLTIMREGRGAPLEVDIVREVIQPAIVRSYIDGGDVSYVRIIGFNQKTVEAVRSTFADALQTAGRDNLKGFVLDLRNTNGGLFDSIIGVTDGLLAKGDIVTTRGRAAGSEKRYTAKDKTEDIAANKPLVVLLNGGTASGAEIIAGALHDNARATLIGTRSFGIGTSQTIYPLAGGNRGGIRLTTVRYFTPTGGYIQAKGIDPDIEVVQDEPEGTKSKATGEATLARHLPGQGSEQGGSQSYVPAAPTDDKALQRAFAELRKK